MRLSRYELTFEGENQNVGFIQGLKDIGISNKKIGELIKELDVKLEIPNYEEFKEKSSTEYPASYFTEKGIAEFKKEINKIIKHIEKKDSGWEVEEINIEVPQEEKVLYQDEYQVVLLTPYK